MKHTVLIVDDYNISNEIVSEHLIRLGFQTFSCLRAEKALEILQLEKIDIIVTDYIMPEMDGLELVTEIRKLPEYKHTPIVFLSATNDEEVIRQAAEFEIAAWIKKPVNLNKLDEVLATIVTSK